MYKAPCLIYLLLSTSLLSQEIGDITIYNSGNSDLAYNQINCLEFDGDEALWIGTQNGLNILGPDNDWSYFDTNTPLSELSSNIVRCLEWAPNIEPPKMFIGTNEGISTVTENAWTADYGGTCDPNNGIVNSLLHNNELWAGSTEGLCVEGMGIKGEWLLQNLSTGFYSNNITSIKQNNNTNLIAIGTMNGGLVTYDGEFNLYYSSNSDILDNTVYDIAFDQNNNIIICTPQAGLGILTENGSWIWLNTINSNLPSNSLRNIVVDNNNNLWITTLEDGLIKYANNTFYHYNTENSNLPDNIINCLTFGPNNNLWLGTENEGLIKINFPSVELSESLKDKVKIYPTCFRSHINIELEEAAQIEIFNSRGQLMNNYRLSPGTHNINTTNYAAGVYLVHLQSDSYKKTRELIKLIW